MAVSDELHVAQNFGLINSCCRDSLVHQELLDFRDIERRWTVTCKNSDDPRDCKGDEHFLQYWPCGQ